jgi:hypothetical protein
MTAFNSIGLPESQVRAFMTATDCVLCRAQVQIYSFQSLR